MDLIIIDKSFEKPWENLAYEECLMDYVINNRNTIILFLWQNRNAVIIGRNQNPWKEIDFDTIRQEHIDLARRITGGGSVYHDLGNLNFSFILPQNKYEEKKTFQIIVEALQNLGIPAIIHGRNDICCNDKKISGSAFSIKEGVGLHHGTLLIDVDLDRMSRCLTPDKAKLASKGVSSVYSRVMNLKSQYKTITVDKVKEAIKNRFLKEYQLEKAKLSDQCDINIKLYNKLVANYSSDDWIYGEDTENYETISEKFNWGIVSVRMQFDNIFIKKCMIETDSLETEIFKLLADKISGRRLVKDDLFVILDEINEFSIEQRMMAEDIINLIIRKIRE